MISYRRILPLLAMVAMTSTASGIVLVDYEAQTLPPTPPWQFISNGPSQETSQHTVFVQDGVLHMIDDALLLGNTLGFLQYVPFDPTKVITVEFRARVLSGESVIDDRAPFDVWLFNGTVRADIAVGPNSITALGDNGLLINEPNDGTEWHVYRYELDPDGIQWWVDANSVGTASVDQLIPEDIPEDQRRINMFITSAAANVELDYLIVRMTSVVAVDIDIKPGSSVNAVNLKSHGVIPVAILTDDDFDATTIDVTTVRFGPSGATEAHRVLHLQDVDGDGDLDAVMHFRTQDTGIQCGQTSVLLTGQTLDGQAIEGVDSIKTLGCK